MSNTPAVLYRAFSSEPYASAMLAGRVRMGQLRYYSSIEDVARADSDEGTSALLTPFEYDPSTLVNDFRGPVVNVTFILSTFGAGADLEAMKEQFGRYVVRIGDPSRLATELTDHFRASPDEALRQPVNLLRVQYNRGQAVATAPETPERFALSCSQKADQFKKEDEWRFCLVTMHAKGPHAITADLGRRLDYCEPLW